MFHQNRKRKTNELISKLGGKLSLRLDFDMEFDEKISPSKPELVTIEMEDLQDAVQIFIQQRDKIIK